jgi:hypothetical protein
MTAPDVVTIVQNLPPTFWETGVAGLIIPILIQRFKKWLEREQEKQEWIYVLISTTLSFLAALGQYVEAGGGQNWTVLGQHTATVLGVITLIYHLPKVGVKALSQTAADAKAGAAARNSTDSSTATPPKTFVPQNSTVLDNEL